MIETGATPKPGSSPRKFNQNETLRLAWCGTIEARKALNLAIHAISNLSDTSKIELHVIGSGPDEHDCRKMTGKVGLINQVVWHGKVSHTEAQDLMNSCHILVHTALKEGTPHVVLEAMSLGLPVICHDACGMGVAVNESCGIKIPLFNPKVSIDGFKAAIECFLQDRSLLERLSSGALKRAAELTWESHIIRISNTYQNILSTTDSNPEF